ncbi:MAG TPA: hypothetical protein VH333_01935 [Pseudonocardiaceae bacterium]|jgi:hypothetical protein|nr:hypothetical protein [Pseudonocardiaceae bacterium]
MTDALSVFGELLRQVAQRYPDAMVDVRPALEVTDMVVADIEWPDTGAPVVQLFGADGSAFATAIVGRYTFDNLRTEDLPDFLASLYETRYEVTARRFPCRMVSLTISFKNDARRVVARYVPADLERWEFEALQR